MIGSRAHAGRDQLLTTVLFTCIVGSMKQAVALGDRNWLAQLSQHHSIVRQELVLRSREWHSLDDGFVATFDGPTRGVRCAAAIIERLRPLGIEVRGGVCILAISISAGRMLAASLYTLPRAQPQLRQHLMCMLPKPGRR